MLDQSVVGVFDSEADANRVLDQLRAQGLSGDDFTIMMRDARPSNGAPSVRPGSPVTGGAATGAIFGGLLGVVLGWMIAIGAISIPGVGNGTPSIPGVGTVVPEGVLAAALAGLALGASIGALVGAFLGLRVPQPEPAAVRPHTGEGRVLVTVHPSAGLSAESVLEAMQAEGGYDVRVYDTGVAALQSRVAGAESRVPSRVSASLSSDWGLASPEAGPEPGDADLPGAALGEDSGEAQAEGTTLGAGAEGGYGDGEARQFGEAALERDEPSALGEI